MSTSSSATSSGFSSTSSSSTSDSIDMSGLSSRLSPSSALAPAPGAYSQLQAPRRLWLFLPLGSDTITAYHGDSGTIDVVKRRCGVTMTRRHIALANVESVRCVPRPYRFDGVFGNFLAAFLWGALWHLVPAIIIGVSVSLGSGDMHRKLGVVWGGLWVACFIISFFLREPVLRIRLRRGDGHTRETVTVTVGTRTQGEALAQHILAAAQGKGTGNAGLAMALREEPALHRRRARWPMVLGVTVFVSLLALLLAIVILVKQCNDCGGCRDNGPPREGCFCC
eukprot:TRINITY_DN19200_c0_g1_i1.p1 TRINITY_DN19200_c0_g1~~TRINITY_DN19200_c0_g1_i1.p1  ORF type:complete len:281 (+),score=21.68 TRINITY_DN19200_c0_g1_i1:123-965(+)